MKALTVRQPWASLIVLGVKVEEYRSRATMVRGRVAIHAAAELDDSQFAGLGISKVWALRGAGYDGRHTLPLGVVLGTVELYGCEKQKTGWGEWAWLLRKVERWAEPVPAVGQLGFWDLERGIQAARCRVEPAGLFEGKAS